MFNGIIYNQGLIKGLKKNPRYISGSLVLEIISNIKLKKSDIGESVSCDGVCLTLIGIGKKSFFFYLSKETIKRSNFKKAKIGKSINIEKSLNHGQKISGHYVQGHVDTTSKIKSIKIYATYENFNALWQGEQFSLKPYPIAQPIFRLSLIWNFYD